MIKHASKSRPIDSIRAVFEANAVESSQSCPKRRATSVDRSLRDVASPSLASSRMSGALLERIQAFERAHHPDKDRIISSASLDWAGLEFEDLPSRKSSLLESFASAEKLAAFHRTRSALAEELVLISRLPLQQRRSFQRRASTGRIRFMEDSTLWECTEGYATRSHQSKDKCDKIGERKEKNTRKGLKRRHSTGGVAVMNDVVGTTDEFWHVYDQTDDNDPQQPMKKKFARRRTVRFSQHVTVWVFAGENTSASDPMDLPQSFVRKTSEGESDAMTPQRKKQMSEDRFASEKSASPPSKPFRRTNSGSRSKSLSSPSRRRRKPSTIPLKGQASPPQQPRRQNMKRSLLSSHSNDKNTKGASKTGSHDNTSPTPPQRQLASRHLDMAKSPPTKDPCASPKKPVRKRNDEDEKSPSTSSPRKPQRRLSNGYTMAINDNGKIILPAESNFLGARSSHGSPKKPVRQPTVCGPKKPVRQPTPRGPKKPTRKKSSHDMSHDELVQSFHESRGSKASKNTLLYDSFCDYSETSSATPSSSSESAIESLDSMFSEDFETPSNDRYVLTIAKPRVRSTKTTESEDIRRERALEWFRRLAMPSYTMMKHHVRTTPGLGITLDDVDLLPWSKTNATFRI